MSWIETTTMKLLSSAPNFSRLPVDVLGDIESHLKMHPLEQRVNVFVSKYYPEHTQQFHKTRLITEINEEIINYQTGLQTKKETADAIDDIIGDLGMGGKKRTKRTKRNKRTKRTYKRRK